MTKFMAILSLLGLLLQRIFDLLGEIININLRRLGIYDKNSDKKP